MYKSIDRMECYHLKIIYIRCKFHSRKKQNVLGVTVHQIELLIGYNLNCWYEFVFERSELCKKYYFITFKSICYTKF